MRRRKILAAIRAQRLPVQILRSQLKALDPNLTYLDKMNRNQLESELVRCVMGPSPSVFLTLHLFREIPPGRRPRGWEWLEAVL